MNHPIITTGNADARYNQLLQEAEQQRRANGLVQRRRLFSLRGVLNGRLGQKDAERKKLVKKAA